MKALEGEDDGFGGLLLWVEVCRYGGGGRFIFWAWGRGLLATAVAMTDESSLRYRLREIRRDVVIVEGSSRPSQSQRRPAMLELMRATWGKVGCARRKFVVFVAGESWPQQDRPAFLVVREVLSMSFREQGGTIRRGSTMPLFACGRLTLMPSVVHKARSRGIVKMIGR